MHSQYERTGQRGRNLVLEPSWIVQMPSMANDRVDLSGPVFMRESGGFAIPPVVAGS